nr:MAG TPA: hypothetical protein [Caudoviricetes sp.]
MLSYYSCVIILVLYHSHASSKNCVSDIFGANSPPVTFTLLSFILFKIQQMFVSAYLLGSYVIIFLQ